MQIFTTLHISEEVELFYYSPTFMNIWEFNFFQSPNPLSSYPTRPIIFHPIFHCNLYCRAVSITDNLCTKQGNSSIFFSKIRGL